MEFECQHAADAATELAMVSRTPPFLILALCHWSTPLRRSGHSIATAAVVALIDTSHRQVICKTL
jgi:hypothetical protein